MICHKKTPYKIIKTIINVLIVIVIPSVATAGLSDSFEFTQGDLVALQLNLYSQAVWKTMLEQQNVLLLPIYDRNEDKIILDIYGTKSQPMEAKSTIDEIIVSLKTDFIPYIKNSYKIEMNTADFMLTYRNRSEEGASKILIWIQGKYKYP